MGDPQWSESELLHNINYLGGFRAAFFMAEAKAVTILVTIILKLSIELTVKSVLSKQAT